MNRGPRWGTIEEYELALDRAATIFAKWKEAKRLDALDIMRVLHGDYNYYVTFKRTWRAAGADQQGYAVISGVDTLEEAERIAKDTYDGYVDEVVVEYRFAPARYKRGDVTQLREKKDEQITIDQ